MSAGGDFALPHDALVHDTLELLAPRFALAVEAALTDCDAAGLDAVLYETYRTDELQRIYFARGRTRCPPWSPVTNAETNLASWHGLGLAVDVIHRRQRWAAPREWFRAVAQHFKRHGCDWGGDWMHEDLPHFQWGRCKASPSDRARELYAKGGFTAVWKEVEAV